LEIKSGLENAVNFSYWAFFSNTYTLDFISKCYFLLISYRQHMPFAPSCVDFPTLYSYVVKADLCVSEEVACLS